jgi:allantoicase
MASAELVDLAAALNGARPLACSDARFSPMHHVLLPGRAADMGGGWETRRRRGPPEHDWLIIELGARGMPQLIEIDTAHFKGNYPESCSIDSIDVPGHGAVRTTELIASEAWRPALPRTHLSAYTRHFFVALPPLPATHLRVNFYPAGGIRRLRVWGKRQATGEITP